MHSISYYLYLSKAIICLKHSHWLLYPKSRDVITSKNIALWQFVGLNKVTEISHPRSFSLSEENSQNRDKEDYV